MSGVNRGAAEPISRGEQRKSLLTERDERIITFMRQGRSVAVIAELEGLEEDYCRKATRRLAAEHDIDYNPGREGVSPGLTDATRRFRNHMAKVVYDYREAPGRHQLEVCRDTGLTQSQQTQAVERGGTHNFKLSELERIARATDQDFTLMMLQGLLPPEVYQKVIRCLSN